MGKVTRCPKCKKLKGPKKYYNNRSRPNGKSQYCIPCHNLVKRLWFKKNPDKKQEMIRRGNLKQLCKVTPEEADQLATTQNNRCAICSKQETTTHSGYGKRRLCIDHDKRTGTVRGLLCAKCNLGLGLLGDNIDGIENARRYLNGESNQK